MLNGEYVPPVVTGREVMQGISSSGRRADERTDLVGRTSTSVCSEQRMPDVADFVVDCLSAIGASQ
jgi:hypothetical protein